MTCRYGEMTTVKSPWLRANNSPIFLSRRFHRTIYFFVEFPEKEAPAGARWLITRNLLDVIASVTEPELSFTPTHRFLLPYKEISNSLNITSDRCSTVEPQGMPGEVILSNLLGYNSWHNTWDHDRTHTSPQNHSSLVEWKATNKNSKVLWNSI